MEKINEGLTPWFPVKSDPPVRKGVYRIFQVPGDDENEWYSYWDGRSFNWISAWPDDASRGRDQLGGGPYVLRWRGLAQSPKGKRA